MEKKQTAIEPAPLTPPLPTNHCLSLFEQRKMGFGWVCYGKCRVQGTVRVGLFPVFRLADEVLEELFGLRSVDELLGQCGVIHQLLHPCGGSGIHFGENGIELAGFQLALEGFGIGA